MTDTFSCIFLKFLIYLYISIYKQDFIISDDTHCPIFNGNHVLCHKQGYFLENLQVLAAVMTDTFWNKWLKVLFLIFHAHFGTLLKCDNNFEIPNTFMCSFNHAYKTIFLVEYNILISCNDRHIFNISRIFFVINVHAVLKHIQFLSTLRDV